MSGSLGIRQVVMQVPWSYYIYQY